MIEDIPQIPEIEIYTWAKEEHIGFVKTVVRRINQEWDVDNPAPAKVQEDITPLVAAVTKEDLDYETSRKASQTADLHDLDNQRDSVLNEVLPYINQMSRMTSMPALQQAALALLPSIELYHPSASASLRNESTQVEQWLQAIAASQELTAAVQTLGLTAQLATLGELNAQCIELLDARSSARSERPTGLLRTDREETDRRYRNFVRKLNAAATMDSDETRYNAIILRLTQDQKEWQEQYEEKRRANRRLSVKSIVVGNRLYQATAHWTWERVCEEFPGDLKVNEDQLRIESLDAKALKAGGLMVCLKGSTLPVLPDDEIDLDQQYELVAIPQ